MSPDSVLSGRQPQAVQSALRVLEEVARAGTGVTAKDIAVNLSMPSATTYRLLNLLVGEGYVVRLPDLTGFALGQKIGLLVDAAVAPTVCTAARDVLAELRLSVRLGVHLFYFTNTAVRSADLDPEFPPPVDDSVLNRHLHACAVGKILLAEKRDIATLIGPRPAAVTARTITAVPDLARELAGVREQSVAVQIGQIREGSGCIAVPIRSGKGTLVAALAMSGRADQEQVLRRQLALLSEFAGRLSPLLA
ncbi:IclR family transcriptional regulator C-terminal domain-containing protein [Antrihabitans sp. YC2-6]|uniref:IclR family transcriptional regulator n=1 Tax=Antrihabitans sp. YC2-6 TaxID=2799498 RepID=UPI0027DB10B0|nr:IclR family transcriptional regulator C-terminal domain-containing protein [Antrihabitans sp. YC2-6]